MWLCGCVRKTSPIDILKNCNCNAKIITNPPSPQKYQAFIAVSNLEIIGVSDDAQLLPAHPLPRLIAGLCYNLLSSGRKI